MTIQPIFHWQFNENEGNVALDAMSKAEGRFHRASLGGHGRIGHAVKLLAQESRISFGNVAGQFGTGDFTVAFGVKILNTHGQNDLNIIGNRSVNGHGNWFLCGLKTREEYFRSKSMKTARARTLPWPRHPACPACPTRNGITSPW